MQNCSALDTGQIINMINVDVKALENCLYIIRSIIIAPPILLVTLYFIYLEVGYSMFVGFIASGIISILVSLLWKRVSRLSKIRMKISDKRLKTINEIFSGIRILKYYAWEKPFMEAVNNIRNEELIMGTYLYLIYYSKFNIYF